MLSPMKACGLARYSETSIWSSETPGRCTREAIPYSVSPRRTAYSSTASAADGAGSLRLAWRRSAGAGDAAGAGARATGGALGAVVRGAGDAAAGAPEDIAGGTWGAAAWRVTGGSSSSVYSRTSRPEAQDSSRITSTNGSWMTRSLWMRR